MNGEPKTSKTIRSETTPYERGEAAARSGAAKPPFPRANSSWAERLYHRGWSDTMDRMIRDGREGSANAR